MKENSDEKDEIYLNDIYKFLMRNKNLIFKFGLVGLIISSLYSIARKPIWKGEFQIVIDNNKSQTSSLSSSNLNGFDISSLGNLGSSVNSLETEVVILKSPSVLIDIFNYVQSKKESNNKFQRFDSWISDSLEITLQKKTSILNLAYKDKDREIIIPVLNKISKAYQTYSNIQRDREIELGLNYFKNQIEKYKKLSAESYTLSTQFSLENNLPSSSSPSFSNLFRISNMQSEIRGQTNNSNGTIESRKIKLSNEITIVQDQLSKLRKFKHNEKDNILFFARAISNNKQLEEYIKPIFLLDNKLVRYYKSGFKEKDPLIQTNLRERDYRINLLKGKVESFLISKKSQLETLLKTYEKPKEVLIKYRLLQNQAFQDKETLRFVQKSYRELELEKARKQDPWKLITSPTLLPYPIGASKKSIVAIGFLSSLILGSFIAFAFERKKGIIYSKNSFNLIPDLPIIADLSFKDKEDLEESLYLLLSGSRLGIKGDIAIIFSGEFSNEKLEKLSRYLNNLMIDRKIILTNDLREALKFPNKVIIAFLGKTNFKDISELSKKIFLNDSNLLGIILISNYKKDLFVI